MISGKEIKMGTILLYTIVFMSKSWLLWSILLALSIACRWIGHNINVQ